MAGLELAEFALLACQFEILGEAAERAADLAAGPPAEVADDEGEGVDDSEASEPAQTPGQFPMRVDLEGVSLTYGVEEEEGDYVLVVKAWLTTPAAPYQLEVITGSRFTIPDEDAPTTAQVASTLLFMSYPYLRETIMGITARSPYTAFNLPPLVRLPHPNVTGVAPGEVATDG